MKKNTYQTKGRLELIGFLSAHPDRQFTADELCMAVNEDASVGKSSVYRLLTRLCEEGVARRFRSESSGRNVYQYIGEHCDCSRHFHEKCTSCGKIQHLDCNGSSAFAEHLLKEHGFAIDCGRSILYGVCSDCRRREEMTHRA